MPVIEQSTREAVRKAHADLRDAHGVPSAEFPGHKEIYCTNLAGYLGRFAVPILDALEASEAEVERLRETLDTAHRDWRAEVELGKALVGVLRQACRDAGGPVVPKPVADAIAGLRVWADA